LSFGTHGTDQMMVQRYLAARDRRDATRALITSGFVVLVQFAVFLLLGVALACFFEQFPPETAIEKGDEALAAFIVAHMPIGLAGVTLAAVFAAAMSTLSSSLNSSATAAVNDFGPLLGTAEMSPTRRVGMCRMLTIVFGLIQVAVAIGAHYYSKSVVDDDMAISVVNDALAIAGFVAGILLGIFSLGVLTEWVRQRAALFGMMGGVAVVSYVKFGTDVAWPWYTVVGAVSTFVFGLLASLAQSPDGKR
jgi:Na+/proline symporter